MAATVDCKRCHAPAHVLVWIDEEESKEKVGLWCEFCGHDVETPEWLRLYLVE